MTGPSCERLAHDVRRMLAFLGNVGLARVEEDADGGSAIFGHFASRRSTMPGVVVLPAAPCAVDFEYHRVRRGRDWAVVGDRTGFAAVALSPRARVDGATVARVAHALHAVGAHTACLDTWRGPENVRKLEGALRLTGFHVCALSSWYNGLARELAADPGPGAWLCEVGNVVRLDPDVLRINAAAMERGCTPLRHPAGAHDPVRTALLRDVPLATEGLYTNAPVEDVGVARQRVLAALRAPSPPPAVGRARRVVREGGCTWVVVTPGGPGGDGRPAFVHRVPEDPAARTVDVVGPDGLDARGRHALAEARRRGVGPGSWCVVHEAWVLRVAEEVSVFTDPLTPRLLADAILHGDPDRAGLCETLAFLFADTVEREGDVLRWTVHVLAGREPELPDHDVCRVYRRDRDVRGVVLAGVRIRRAQR